MVCKFFKSFSLIFAGSHFSDALSNLSHISLITLAIPAQTSPLNSKFWLNDSIDLNKTQYSLDSMMHDLTIPAFSISRKAHKIGALSAFSSSETKKISFAFFFKLKMVWLLKYSNSCW